MAESHEKNSFNFCLSFAFALIYCSDKTCRSFIEIFFVFRPIINRSSVLQSKEINTKTSLLVTP